MGTSDLPDTCMPKAQGLQAYISGKSQVPMLQLLCNTSKAGSLDADTSVVTVSFIYACLEDSIMVIYTSKTENFQLEE